jgi:hypothetical protein
MTEVVTLLADREAPARVGAVRALATNGGDCGALLLRLKVLTGDPESEILAECFSGLLASSPEKSLAFVAGYLNDRNPDVAEVAVLTLGESRLPGAFKVLRDKFGRTAAAALRKVLLFAMAQSRLEEAHTFLVQLIETENATTVSDILEALSIYRHSDRLRESIAERLRVRGDQALLREFATRFAE